MTRRGRSVAGRGVLSLALLAALTGSAARATDPALGIGMTDWAGAQQPGKGAEIIEVRGQSPAAESGLQPHDVIIGIDDQKVASAADVVAEVAAAREHGRDAVSLLILRGRTTYYAAVKLGEC